MSLYKKENGNLEKLAGGVSVLKPDDLSGMKIFSSVLDVFPNFNSETTLIDVILSMPNKTILSFDTTGEGTSITSKNNNIKELVGSYYTNILIIKRQNDRVMIWINILGNRNKNTSFLGMFYSANTVEPYITLTRIHSEDWNDVQLQNSWYNFETGFSNVQFRKENNRVYLRGLLHTPKSGPIQETTIFTLPSGYRPKYSKVFSVRGEALDPTNNKTAFVFRLDIRPSGIVIFEPFNARVDGSNGGFISLEGISFEID